MQLAPQTTIISGEAGSRLLTMMVDRSIQSYSLGKYCQGHVSEYNVSIGLFWDDFKSTFCSIQSRDAIQT